MTVKCQVLIDDSVSPLICEFVTLPRLGETVFLEESGRDVSAIVIDVGHRAGGASQKCDSPLVIVTVSTSLRPAVLRLREERVQDR